MVVNSGTEQKDRVDIIPSGGRWHQVYGALCLLFRDALVSLRACLYGGITQHSYCTVVLSMSTLIPPDE